ncbi:MAG TPA: phage/plasmid primase, P4 family [Pirellulales bacterium]|nr:phage/plasmid primase, P4 family [Pirellulales bacterium]
MNRNFDREHIARSLSLLHLPESVIELRILAERGTHSGYYTDRERLIDDAKSWSGRGNCYVTLNPVHPDCAARVLNRVAWAKRGMTTKDSEIIHRTGLLLDFDPVRLTGIASTSDEHEAAIELARKVREWLKEQGWPDPLFISSGNGAALFYRLDLPAEDGDLVKRVLKEFARRFDSDAVKIDTSVHNAARIVRLAGTLNMKGENLPERPHRLASILEASDSLDTVSREQLEQLIGEGAPSAHEPYGFELQAGGDGFDVAKWLDERGVEYAKETCNSGTLYRLTKCPKKGPGHEDGRAYIIQHDGGGISAGCHHAKCKSLRWREMRTLIDPQFDAAATRAITGGNFESPNDCHRFARKHLDETKSEDGVYQYALDGDTVYAWKNSRWQPLSDAELRRRLTRAVKAEADRMAQAARRRGLDACALDVTTRFVGNVRNALESMIPQVERQPAWLSGAAPWLAEEILACSDGLIHLPSFAAGKADYRLPLTPRFFSALNLGYPFDPSGYPPRLWLEFLHQVWPDDPASVALLQEWLGYLLTLDTSQQKMLLMFGPGGGGKGTILELTSRLLGLANVTSLTLPDLKESHALQDLVGKSLCLFPDASIPSRMDKAPIVERLKSITGEDLISINPKGKPRHSTKLNTRLMIATNDMLELTDPSGAISRRLLVLRFTRSFEANPDPDLRSKLIGELPGILQWAIQGWQRLRQQGRFSEAESGREVKASLRETGSPMKAFIEECCMLDPEATECKDAVYERWTDWCKEDGREPGHKHAFSALLFAAAPNVKSVKPRIDDRRVPSYKGIALPCHEPAFEFEDDVLGWAILSPEEADEYVRSVIELMKQDSRWRFAS